MKMTTATLILCCLLLGLTYSVHSTGLKLAFTWTRISYAVTGSNLQVKPVENDTDPPPSNDSIIFPSELDDIIERDADSFNEENYKFKLNIPIGANRWKDKLFVTVPRRRFGIPSTLNYVPINSTVKHNAPLIPYPDLRTNKLRIGPGPEDLVSVYRVTVDQCDRLWVVDTGIIEHPNNRTQIGPQKLVIIDLNTDKIIKTYNFKKSDLTNKTTLALVTVDVTADTCEDAYAYFPDFLGYGVVVYSLKKNDSWRITHNYFLIEPNAGDFLIGGARFKWSDGVFSGALTDIRSDGYRNYIFHALVGTHLYAVSTRILRDKELATRSQHGEDFTILGDRGRDWQSSASDLHQSSGVLFLALVNQNGVGCWNVNKPFLTANLGIVQKDEKSMIYPSDLKIYKDDVIVMTNSMPIFIYSELNYDEINFRVWIGNVYEAIKGTPCEIQEIAQ